MRSIICRKQKIYMKLYRQVKGDLFLLELSTVKKIIFVLIRSLISKKQKRFEEQSMTDYKYQGEIKDNLKLVFGLE